MRQPMHRLLVSAVPELPRNSLETPSGKCASVSRSCSNTPIFPPIKLDPSLFVIFHEMTLWHIFLRYQFSIFIFFLKFISTTSTRISSRWPIHIINPVDKTKLPCYAPHRRSTTISLETYPLYSKHGLLRSRPDVSVGGYWKNGNKPISQLFECFSNM